MFQHIVYSLANRQGLFAYVRTCKTRLDTTTKFMVVVTLLFDLVINFIISWQHVLSCTVWTWLLIYHDGYNNIVQHAWTSLSTTMFKLASTGMFKPVNRQIQAVCFYMCMTHIWPRSTYMYSLARSRCWFYGGRKIGEPGEKPSKHGRDQQLYSHKFQVRQSTWDYTQVGLTSELSGERQRTNHIRHSCWPSRRERDRQLTINLPQNQSLVYWPYPMVYQNTPSKT